MVSETMVQKAKELLEQLYEYCDKIDETPMGLKYQNKGLTLRQSLFLDISNYLMYLSASDGTVSLSEAKFLGDLLGYSISPDEIISLIREHNIYSTKFENTVPLTLQCIIKVDKILQKKVAGFDIESSASAIFTSFFNALGKAFILCDQNINENERRDFLIYKDTLVSYVRKELSGGIQKSGATQNTLKSHYELLKKTTE